MRSRPRWTRASPASTSTASAAPTLSAGGTPSRRDACSTLPAPQSAPPSAWTASMRPTVRRPSPSGRTPILQAASEPPAARSSGLMPSGRPSRGLVPLSAGSIPGRSQRRSRGPMSGSGRPVRSTSAGSILPGPRSPPRARMPPLPPISSTATSAPTSPASRPETIRGRGAPPLSARPTLRFSRRG